MQFVLVLLMMYVFCILVGVATFYGLPLATTITLTVVICVLSWLVDVRTVRLVVAGRWRGWFGYQTSAVNVKNDPQMLKIVILVLVVALFTSLGFLARGLWRDYWWKMEVYGLAGYEGSTRAMHDFRDGKLRLFVISGERDDDKYSGTNDGPFQVWFPQYYTGVYPMRYSMEQQVEFYNSKMRYMHEHPEQFLTTTNIIKP